ncbi:glycosyltransferase family 4 protein [Halorussus amylolyticus]|uniref:glycosyltransferase family 4 protein n=1 Tax=Halorussus amylolyticus TaxID=1126242 RepID=UPI0010520815|nr:glycosyltransferase family 4 protein [Halorussus amylolyticus]
MGSRDAKMLTFLTEYFYPEESSTAQLLTELAVELSESYDVSAVTNLPNYHDIDQHKAVSKRERHEDVSVRRLRGTRFDKDSLVLRIVNWLSFTLLTTLHLARRQTDVLLVVSNPPILPFAAWVKKRVSGTPYVYLIHDMYPDMPIGLGILSEDSLIARIWERGMRILYRDADRIVVLGGSMEDRLVEKMGADAGFDPEKVSVIPNWEDEEFIQPMAKTKNEFAAEQGTREKFTVLYSGNIGRFHELKTVIDAIDILEKQGREDIELLIIGEGARKEELIQYVTESDVKNIRFLPFQPRDRLPETLTCADASLVGIKPEMEGMCVSSKLYSSLAAGMPVLAVVGESDEVARVVREESCGEYISPSDAEKAAKTIALWADNPAEVSRYGQNARTALENNYTKAHAVEAYESLLSDII